MSEIKDQHFLVVDDSVNMRRILVRMLEGEGAASITQAGDGKKALMEVEESVKSGKPISFILLDWNMPTMTGIDFLRKLRTIPSFEKTPVVMISAEAQTENVVAAVKAGVSSYVVKPFVRDIVLKKINKILSGQ